MGILKSSFIYSYSRVYWFDPTKSPFEDKKEYLDATEIETGEECRIFLFKQPPANCSFDGRKVIVYYLKGSTRFPRNKEIHIKFFSSDFIDLLNKALESDFISKNNFVKEFFPFVKEFFPDDKNILLYKYYSSSQSVERYTSIMDGDVSFANPQTFNDPFDCDYEDIIKQRKKNCFKALCLTPEYDDILMWSYYANNHKGYCLGYNLKDILIELNKQFTGLCIIGNVAYKPRRPTYAKTKSLSFFNELMFVIECTFTKFENWKHEKEYRILMLDDNPSSDYFTINVPIKAEYIGEESGIRSKKAKKLKKDTSAYLLK